MRRLALALAAGGVLAASPATALAATPPLTGSFAFEDQFTVQPGDPASCSFPIAFDLQVRGTFQLFLDAQGQPARLLLHEHWTGTGTANGKYVIEHAAQHNRVDLISGVSATAGQIHDQVPFGGVVIHDSGLLRFDGNGNLTFEAGPHQGFNGDPPRFRSSARHCPDLKQARQAKLERGTLELQPRHQVSEPRKEQRENKNSTVQNHHRAHQRPSNHRRPGYARARQRGARPLRPGIR